MESCSNVPLQCVTLDPLHNTPARLMVGDILKLKPFLGSHSLFSYRNHPINAVDILGLVTSLKQKEDTWVCHVDDGTGSIQCFCSIKSPVNSSLSQLMMKNISVSLHRRLSGADSESSISLGNFIRVIGNIKLSLWSENIYISNCTWNILKHRNMDEMWLQSFREQIKLYQEVYDQPFSLNEETLRSAKTFLSKELRENLNKTLNPIVTRFIKDSENTSSFFGYEMLELDEVKLAVSTCFPSTDISENIKLLSKNEQNAIITNSVATLLHKHVANGVLMKKKCLSHEVVTHMDQMDARYFITANCKPFLTLVQNAVLNLVKQEKPVTGSSVLQSLESCDFNFVRYCKHGMVVVENALKSLNIDFYH